MPRSNPSHTAEIASLIEAGIALVEQGRAAEALETIEQAIALGADDVHAHNTRGRALLDLGRGEDALAAFTLASARAPDNAGPAINIGLALNALGRPAEALAATDAVVAQWPELRLGRRHHALALANLGRKAEALQAFQFMLAEWPDDLDLLTDRGALLLGMEQFTAALSSFAQAAAMAPDDASAVFNHATALQALDRHADAVAAFEQALLLAPDMAAARINRANSLRRLTRHQDAIAEYRRVLETNSHNAVALGNLGKTLSEIGQRGPALAALDAAIAADPAIAETRWMRVTATIPSVRSAGDDVAAIRAEFAAALADYDRWSLAAGDLPAVVNVGRPHPFFLAYQEENNRDLMAGYGTHCARVMGRWLQDSGLSPSPPRSPPSGKLRVGIVSAHVLTQSVWLAIVRGWLWNADRDRIAYHVFYLGADRDPQTDLAEQLSARFEYGVRGLRDWVTAIRASELDALVYPEIGMDPLTIKLASLRLAPVQVAAWGHPETTGLPTIDAFVSAAALEPPGADAHYTEHLVSLPGLGCCYTPLPIVAEPPDLAALGLRGDVPILLCPGVPFKYVPEYDRAYVEIARRVGRCQMVFFRQDTNPLLSDAVFARMAAVFAEAGLDFADYVRPIPWQTHARFYGLMQRADLFLDTIGFSGFNTAIQAIECGLPVVTMEGKFMRGRLASGILRQMDMPELVATDLPGYVDIATSLLADPGAMAAARAKIRRNRDRLWGDIGTVRGFEDFLHAACRGQA